MYMHIPIRLRLFLPKFKSLQFVANFMNERKTKMKTTKLNTNGQHEQEIPVIGLGTWQAQAQEMEEVVSKALQLGYRHIDTAFNYNNEEAIGNAIEKWIKTGVGKREDLFITTKLPHIGNRPQDVRRFLRMSLDKLKLSYVDLYLVHMPFGFICDEITLTPAIDSNGNFQIDKATDHVAVWKVMEEQVQDGLAKNIGLSNFNADQIKKVYKNAIIKPAVLQVELHAYMQQKELRKLCDELNIAVTAYSPLGSPGAKAHFQNKYNFALDAFPDILGHPTVNKLASKYNKTPGQILLRHLTQQNIVIIPKSANPTRLTENFNIFDFDLSNVDLEELNELDKGENGRIFNFLFFKGVEKHPEYPFKKKIV